MSTCTFILRLGARYTPGFLQCLFDLFIRRRSIKTKALYIRTVSLSLTHLQMQQFQGCNGVLKLWFSWLWVIHCSIDKLANNA